MTVAKKGCCTPRREGEGALPSIDLSPAKAPARLGSTEGMIRIEGGIYRIGYEGPGAWVADG